MCIKEEAERQSIEFMNHLVEISPMHRTNKILYEATRLNYMSGFMDGAKTQEKINNNAMYDYNELILISEKISQFLLNRMQGLTKMSAQEFLLTLKKYHTL